MSIAWVKFLLHFTAMIFFMLAVPLAQMNENGIIQDETIFALCLLWGIVFTLTATQL